MLDIRTEGVSRQAEKITNKDTNDVCIILAQHISAALETYQCNIV